jgi:hypothetical protein
MINDLEQAVLSRIEERMAAGVNNVSVQRGVESLPVPGVAVSIEEGKFSREASDNFKLEATGYVDIVFSELSSDELRRKGVYLILEGVYQALLLQTLDLKIKPIVPKDFRNITSKEDHDEGKIVFTLSFTTSWIVTKLDDEAATDLLIVGLGYYLNPAAETPTAADTVTLEDTL